MITDEEMDAVADKFELYGYSVGFARAIYQLGRQHQRESDAALCDERHYNWRWDDSPDSTSGPRECAEAIRNNTGEMK